MTIKLIYFLFSFPFSIMCFRLLKLKPMFALIKEWEATQFVAVEWTSTRRLCPY